MIILHKGSLLVVYAFIVKKMRHFSHTPEARDVLFNSVTMDFDRLEHLIFAYLGGSWFQFYSYVFKSRQQWKYIQQESEAESRSHINSEKRTPRENQHPQTSP